jgi:hypothetical protein
MNSSVHHRAAGRLFSSSEDGVFEEGILTVRAVMPRSGGVGFPGSATWNKESFPEVRGSEGIGRRVCPCITGLKYGVGSH